MNARPTKAVEKLHEWLVTKGVDQDGDGERNSFGTPHGFADPYVNDDHDEMDGAEYVIHGLENGVIQA